jgi:hypothetical protein
MISVLPLAFSEILEIINRSTPEDLSVYLVGGAVRDVFLKRDTHDLDFVQSHNVVETGRRVANALNGDFYILDSDRNTVRVIYTKPGNVRFFLDFAQFRGPDLISDLHHRDFTINAMAISVQDSEGLIDPLNGIQDLNSGIIRTCSETTFKDDPIRILRCVRLAVEYGFRILPDTKKLIPNSLGKLEQVSQERKRDELFRMLEGPNPALAARLLELLGAMGKILPDIPALRDNSIKPLHSNYGWERVLDTVKHINSTLDVLGIEHQPETSGNWTSALISLRLGRYRNNIHTHFADTITPGRSIRSLLLLAALYLNIEEFNLYKLIEDETTDINTVHLSSGAILNNRARELRLSNKEIERLEIIVNNYTQPFLLTESDAPQSRGVIYRYFRDYGPAGVDICFLAIACKISSYGNLPDQDVWVNLLDTIRELLEAWWEKRGDVISPKLLISGNDLINIFHLEPGPRIGLMLEAIREAQATKEVENREEALAYANTWITDN